MLASEYLVEAVYGQVSLALADALCAFWLANGAISDSAEALRRASEVVIVARTPAGEIVGVNSVYPGRFSDSAQNYHFYRLFIRSSDRVRGLGSRMTRAAADCLRQRQDGMAGMALITENPKLMERGGQRLLQRLGWEYAGRGLLGRDVWKIDFHALPETRTQP
ncbi:hypothetical protein Q9Q94_05405 [Uliginosibacterium sp. 31-16]|uniref:GNAT family N-acetyltransferase n=1 Tax=Uliginosibacterium sp. 31-16 TaxID=3068315 RepID=UPI00273E3B58|nr:GNAT family N-acetyltransferase [Uliginosibacterium sp. 31-16]MDP5238955.1 hypothetical protein [Uliginosibacterium sp. 31-16]